MFFFSKTIGVFFFLFCWANVNILWWQRWSFLVNMPIKSTSFSTNFIKAFVSYLWSAPTLCCVPFLWFSFKMEKLGHFSPFKNGFLSWSKRLKHFYGETYSTIFPKQLLLVVISYKENLVMDRGPLAKVVRNSSCNLWRPDSKFFTCRTLTDQSGPN